MPTLASYCFGKLPITGDFIRVSSGAPELGHLDKWLQEGIYRSQQHDANQWTQRFDALGSRRFLYACAATGGMLAGVCIASRDSAGRRYPFMIVTRLEHALAGESLVRLPLSLSEGFEAAEQFLAMGEWEGLELPEFQAKVSELGWERDRERAAKDFQQYAGSCPAERFWNSLLGAAPAARRATLLHDLRQLMTRFPPRWALRLPSSGAETEVAFWLAIANLWTPRNTCPTFVSWTKPKSLDRAGDLCLVYDELSARLFDPVFWPEVDSDYGFDLAHNRGARRDWVAAAEAAFGAAVSTGGTIQEILSKIKNS